MKVSLNYFKTYLIMKIPIDIEIDQGIINSTGKILKSRVIILSLRKKVTKGFLKGNFYTKVSLRIKFFLNWLTKTVN